MKRFIALILFSFAAYSAIAQKSDDIVPDSFLVAARGTAIQLWLESKTTLIVKDVSIDELVQSLIGREKISRENFGCLGEISISSENKSVREILWTVQRRIDCRFVIDKKTLALRLVPKSGGGDVDSGNDPMEMP